MTRKQRRLTYIAGAGAVLAVAVALSLYASRGAILYFYDPSDIVEQSLAPGSRVRLGGLVEGGSVVRGESATVRFAVTDMATSIPVSYTGILPDLFREGQGVVVEGALDRNGLFVADSVLAKHDENYMPAEVAESLKKRGVWKDGEPVKAQ